MSPPKETQKHFLANLPTGRFVSETDLGVLEGLLAGLLSAAALSWPPSWADPERFIAHLAQKIPPGADIEVHLRRLNAADFYLAFCCSEGHPEAIAAFEKAYGKEITRSLGELGLPADVIEETAQILRHRFHLGSAGHPPALSGYTGTGSLRAWVRVSALREGYRWAEQNKRWDFRGDEALAELPSHEDDPELRHLKAHYRNEFKAAISAAMSSLTVRQRNLLRHHYLDGMTTEEIGAMYHAHRATVFRWLVKARHAVQIQTRKFLMAKLEVDRPAYESILRLINSRLDLSLRTFFQI